MCGVCVCFTIYTISISILCVSQEGLSLAESNQQIHGFQKGEIFEKQRHCGPFVSVSCSFSAIQVAAVCTNKMVSIYIHTCVYVSVY